MKDEGGRGNYECERRRPLSVVICPLFLLHRPSPGACRSGQLTTDQGQRTKDKGLSFAFSIRNSAFTLHTSHFIDFILHTSYFICTSAIGYETAVVRAEKTGEPIR